MADGIEMAWHGLKEAYAAIDRISAQADAATREIVAKSAAVVEKAAKGNFSGSHKRGQPHVGGDRPNVVTGTLRRSIRPEPIVRVGLGEYGTTIGPRTVYARRVELGMNGKGAYPYFRPGVEDTKDELRAIAAETWRKFLTG